MLSTKYRRHTIIAHWSGMKLFGQLEKDWFSYEWVGGWPVRHIIDRPQGQFHVVSRDASVTRDDAVVLVVAAITGNTFVLDLRDYSTLAAGRKNAGK